MLMGFNSALVKGSWLLVLCSYLDATKSSKEDKRVRVASTSSESSLSSLSSLGTGASSSTSSEDLRASRRQADKSSRRFRGAGEKSTETSNEGADFASVLPAQKVAAVAGRSVSARHTAFVAQSHSEHDCEVVKMSKDLLNFIYGYSPTENPRKGRRPTMGGFVTSCVSFMEGIEKAVAGESVSSAPSIASVVSSSDWKDKYRKLSEYFVSKFPPLVDEFLASTGDHFELAASISKNKNTRAIVENFSDVARSSSDIKIFEKLLSELKGSFASSVPSAVSTNADIHNSFASLGQVKRAYYEKLRELSVGQDPAGLISSRGVLDIKYDDIIKLLRSHQHHQKITHSSRVLPRTPNVPKEQKDIIDALDSAFKLGQGMVDEVVAFERGIRLPFREYGMTKEEKMGLNVSTASKIQEFREVFGETRKKVADEFEKLAQSLPVPAKSSLRRPGERKSKGAEEKPKSKGREEKPKSREEKPKSKGREEKLKVSEEKPKTSGEEDKCKSDEEGSSKVKGSGEKSKDKEEESKLSEEESSGDKSSDKRPKSREEESKLSGGE